MKHSLKKRLRELNHSSRAFATIYKWASGVKTRHYAEMDDEEFLRRKFLENTGEELDLDDPRTFNMKLQWLKLHDRNPLYTTLVDKYAVKKYVAERIGEEHVIPVVGGPWTSAGDIDFDTLPDKFVLKCNHDCGSVVICTDKSKLDRDKVRRMLGRALERNYYYVGREWPYKNVDPCIFAEKYMVDESGVELKDYKFFCFGGKVRCMLIVSGRSTGDTTGDWFDENFNRLPFEQGFRNSSINYDVPQGFDEMKLLAELLSSGFPHVRVDFYSIEDVVYFGEFTFFDSGGMEEFRPNEWDYMFGSWIDLKAAFDIQEAL